MTDVETAANGAPPQESAVMPFMEHLKEFRTRLIRAFIALFITTAISFVFARQVFVILLE
ncbi:MAG: twin-arginine translocase subunit TatC, partial [Anaerolineae bacterium]|nr:twin-arginine translocase subunit TatC [Anaerolineae bacterium]